MAIVILSSDGDQSTSQVMDWLLSRGEKVIRINGDDLLDISSIRIGSESSIVLSRDGVEVDLNDLTAFWYRKEDFRLRNRKLNLDLDERLTGRLQSTINDGIRKTKSYIHYKLSGKRHLGNFNTVDLNKLAVLSRASDLGIKIPDTLITSRKNELLDFKKKHQRIITKAISEAFIFSIEDVANIYNYTSEISESDINELTDQFPTSLFQENISKKYELRIFYLDGECYSMAIFSQSDQQTSQDFRNYNLNRPNRTVPYKLPAKVKRKLKALMSALSLNTGSIDMAVDFNNEHIFFEVNPVGQYGMTSQPCNYHLDEKIADFLMK